MKWIRGNEVDGVKGWEKGDVVILIDGMGLNGGDVVEGRGGWGGGRVVGVLGW